LVTVGGVLQDISAYNINGFFIVFVAPPGNGVNIRVIHLGIRRDLTSLPNNSSLNSPTIINGTVSSLSTPLTAGQGGTGATTLASGGLLVGNGTAAIGIASAAQIVAAVGATAVTNATNATNATNVTGTTTASVVTSALGSGTADATKVLLGDRTWGLRATLASNTFAGAQIGTVTALTSTAAAMAINLATNNNFSHTTTENTTLSAPSNPVAGQSGVITITQGATARLLAYNTFWKFPGGTIPTLSAIAGAVDIFAYNVDSATRASCQLIKDVK
jgi:hypothetical protein